MTAKELSEKKRKALPVKPDIKKPKKQDDLPDWENGVVYTPDGYYANNLNSDEYIDACFPEKIIVAKVTLQSGEKAVVYFDNEADFQFASNVLPSVRALSKKETESLDKDSVHLWSYDTTNKQKLLGGSTLSTR